MTNTDTKIIAKDPLFQPLQIKHLTLKNRIMSTSHASGMDDDGMPGGPTYRSYDGGSPTRSRYVGPLLSQG